MTLGSLLSFIEHKLAARCRQNFKKRNRRLNSRLKSHRVHRKAAVLPAEASVSTGSTLVDGWVHLVTAVVGLRMTEFPQAGLGLLGCQDPLLSCLMKQIFRLYAARIESRFIMFINVN